MRYRPVRADPVYMQYCCCDSKLAQRSQEQHSVDIVWTEPNIA